ncbi:unnamed protein product [Sphagnum jensenii]|uniref:YTH domain-containing protein n=1 Tax=Sphagnum jensenii TaxID=128206 RepID=A0ABP1B9D9_9BRYO
MQQAIAGRCPMKSAGAAGDTAIIATPYQHEQMVRQVATPPSKVLEKATSSRRKMMEKSVLDDIMGDPDDFQDLADSDAISESDCGRWEDAVRAALEDEAAVGGAQQETMEPEEIKPEVPRHAVLKEDCPADGALPDPSHRPNASEDAGSFLQSSEVQLQNNGKVGKSRQNGNVGTMTKAAKQQKVYHTKYFIIKSLNHHNLAKSIEKGIWATQAMNEPVLNEAFETCERVVLVFSVNMSSHFQGYARMASPIGRRRANIWSEANEGANPWGGTFRVEWLCLYDLPFQKTVHLKNPLNSFKPVKISRDCQELTKEIGEALCALIDEGADQEGRPKRKLGPDGMVTQVTKKTRELTGEGLYGQRLPPAPAAGPGLPLMYHPPSMAPPEAFTSARPIVRPSGSFPSKPMQTSDHPRPSRSRSPHLAPSEKRARELIRDRERGSDKERTRSRSSSRSVDLAAEEDLLNMTYEEYLQRHGLGHCNGYNQVGYNGPAGGLGYGGWTGGGGGMAYSPDDQYAKYLANWYGGQAPSDRLHAMEHGSRGPDPGWHGQLVDDGMRRPLRDVEGNGSADFWKHNGWVSHLH